MRSTRLSSVAWMIAACSSAPPLPPTPVMRSGSRLEARYEQVGDVRRFVGWRDTARDEDCLFEPFSGPAGAHRCVPGAAVKKVDFAFADAACTVPLYRYEHGGGDDAWALLAPQAPCASATRIFRPVPADTYWTAPLSGIGNCVDFGSFGEVRLGEEVAADAFVGAREQSEGIDRLIQQLFLVGEDGSLTPWDGFDAARDEDVQVRKAAGGAMRWMPVDTDGCGAAPVAGLPPAEFAPATTVEQGDGPVRVRRNGDPDGRALLARAGVDSFIDSTYGPCAPTRAADGKLRCLPPQNVFVFVDVGLPFFHDPGCTVGVASFYVPSDADEPTWISDGGRVFSVGARVASDTLFDFSASRCTRVMDLVPFNAFYLYGAEIPPERFAEVQEIVDNH